MQNQLNLAISSKIGKQTLITKYENEIKEKNQKIENLIHRNKLQDDELKNYKGIKHVSEVIKKVKLKEKNR